MLHIHKQSYKDTVSNQIGVLGQTAGNLFCLQESPFSKVLFNVILY